MKSFIISVIATFLSLVVIDYFSKSVKLLIKLIEQPELLERPLSEEVEI